LISGAFRRFQAALRGLSLLPTHHPSFIRPIIAQTHPRKDFSDCVAFQETAEFQGLHERRNEWILSKGPNERKKDLMNGFSRLPERLASLSCHLRHVICAGESALNGVGQSGGHNRHSLSPFFVH
jgi:hypothetical protein